MINVRIKYKSGKVETVAMALSAYSENLAMLTSEGRLVSFRIV